MQNFLAPDPQMTKVLLLPVTVLGVICSSSCGMWTHPSWDANPAPASLWIYIHESGRVPTGQGTSVRSLISTESPTLSPFFYPCDQCLLFIETNMTSFQTIGGLLSGKPDMVLYSKAFKQFHHWENRLKLTRSAFNVLHMRPLCVLSSYLSLFANML